MTDRLVIAAIQANPTVGDIRANEALARRSMARATELGADIAVFSELFLIGYPPEDLALKPAALAACRASLEALALDTARGCAALITLPCRGEDGRPKNAVALIEGGEIKGFSCKIALPNYGVFDEKRIFEPGEKPRAFEFRGIKLGAPICEDIWLEDVCAELGRQGAEILLVPNGSPFRRSSGEERLAVACDRVAATGLPLVYVNQIGGQDELVFDGASFALQGDGEMCMSLPMFEEAIACSTWKKHAGGAWRCESARRAVWPEPAEAIYRAMVVGLRDYVTKSGFSGVLLGLSGGVDSALSLVVARDALGPGGVRAFMLPSRYTGPESREDARACARAVGVALETIPIEPAIAAFDAMLADAFDGMTADITEENLQARIRGVTLMALSNKLGLMLLTTGNKSEMAVGYATLYGDMCGGYNVLKDLYKVEVYALCDWRNANAFDDGPANPIPRRVLTKAPSAELRPDQTDQDSLPPYDELDAILQELVEEDASLDEIVARGHDPLTVERIQRLLYNSEYKRRQAAPGVKIGGKAFGRDRRYPIVNGFRDRVSR
ncbi:MAG TPA: NAD+ synthase [Caulobacteraceae bacterium]